MNINLRHTFLEETTNQMHWAWERNTSNRRTVWKCCFDSYLEDAALVCLRLCVLVFSTTVLSNGSNEYVTERFSTFQLIVLVFQPATLGYCLVSLFPSTSLLPQQAKAQINPLYPTSTPNRRQSKQLKSKIQYFPQEMVETKIKVMLMLLRVSCMCK